MGGSKRKARIQLPEKRDTTENVSLFVGGSKGKVGIQLKCNLGKLKVMHMIGG